MTPERDANSHPNPRIGHQLAGWLMADMDALVDLIEVTESTVFGRVEVLSSASRLMEALARAVKAATQPNAD